MIEFHAPCLPPRATSQQKGVQRVNRSTRNRRGLVFFKRKEVAEAESLYAGLFTPHAPPAPIEGPLRLFLGFLYPYLKSTRKRDIAAGTWIWHEGTPDWDNAAKGAADVLKRCGYYHDDAQVCWGTAAKAHVPPHQAGIYVILKPMPPAHESAAVAAMRARIEANQRANPAPATMCPVCWHRYGHAISARPGQACTFCQTVAPSLVSAEPPPLELSDDFGPPLIDPDDLFSSHS